MSRLRIINLGLPKSGTTTLSKALKRSQMYVADHRIRPRQTAETNLHGQFVGDLIYRGYFHAGDPLDGLDLFDAFTEINVLREGQSLWPQTDWGVLSAIIDHHPGARFVATRRDAFDMSQSMLKWNNLALERLPGQMVPGLPQGYGETTAERVRWIEAHYAHLERLFAGSDLYMELPVEAEDAATRLSDFIGRDVAWWGRANANTELSA